MGQPALEARLHDSGSGKSPALLPAVLGNLRRELLRAAVILHHPTRYMHVQMLQTLRQKYALAGPSPVCELCAERL